MLTTALRLSLLLCLLSPPLASLSTRLMPVLPWSSHGRTRLATKQAVSCVQCGLRCMQRADCQAIACAPAGMFNSTCRLLAAAEGDQTAEPEPEPEPEPETETTTQTQVLSEVCAVHWVKFGSACFRLYDSLQDWESSKRTCPLLHSGAQLASIRPEEDDFVTSLLSQHSVFIGLEHAPTSSGPYNFLWLDGTEVDLIAWREEPKSPSNSPTQRLCTVATAETAEWVDHVVSHSMERHRSLCKYSLV